MVDSADVVAKKNVSHKEVLLERGEWQGFLSFATRCKFRKIPWNNAPPPSYFPNPPRGVRLFELLARCA
jgi:hypothetical protein